VGPASEEPSFANLISIPQMMLALQPVLADDRPVPRFHTRRLYERVLKRTIDLLGALSLLCVLSPVLLVVALLIWLSDGWPIFYLRRVVGAEGEFDAYKFRTMCRNADAILEANPELREAFTQNFKLQSDPRVTRVGEWLRKYSLDELPQLINVLRGQMSLVGPRMITAQELHKYGEHADLLMTVKPGLTGYWQVKGRQDVSYEERVRMDVYYITHWTLGLDLRILVETPWKVIKGKGAY
jgi:lipopolysaccharide/colanic/teichoic acid biosynthesis glycosyltransferase